MEIELKMLIARNDLDRVLRARAVKRCAQGRAQKSELMNVYYDTPELDLHGERLALRLRQWGGHWLQGLKGGAASTAGLTEREEYEWPVPGPSVDLTLLDATPYGPVFARRRVREALRPVFRTRFTRTLRQLVEGRGFRVERTLSSHVLYSRRKHWTGGLFERLGDLFPTLGAHLILIARKS